jgi:hypothetical protein
VPPAHENQRGGQDDAAGEAGEEKPSRLGELHRDRDNDRNQR